MAGVDEGILERTDALIAKADAVLTTYRPPPPNVFTTSTLDSGAFAEWQTQSLSFLVTVLGDEHVYVSSFREKVTGPSRSAVSAGAGILRGLREDLEHGYLSDVRVLVASEVFTDFIEMAEHLVEAGYKDAAASLAGAVLEDGLRRIAASHGVNLKSREDLGSLSAKCAQAGVYNRLVQKKVALWTGVRNHADHGEFVEYAEADVREMISGITDFLAAHLR